MKPIFEFSVFHSPFSPNSFPSPYPAAPASYDFPIRRDLKLFETTAFFASRSVKRSFFSDIFPIFVKSDPRFRTGPFFSKRVPKGKNSIQLDQPV